MALSLAPFGISNDPVTLRERLHAAFDFQNTGGFLVGIVHFIGFAAAGFSGAMAHRSWAKSHKILAVVLIISGCVMLEAAKLWVPLRHALVVDVIVKILGAMAGAGIALRTMGSEMGGQRRLSRFAAMIISFLTLAAWWAVGLKPLTGALKLDWNPDFRLLLGNEGDGQRPWEGKVHRLAISDRALTSSEIASSKRGGLSGALVDYHFPDPQGFSAKPVGKLAQDPSLIMAATDSPEGAMSTQGPASALAGAINRSNAFSVLVTIETTDLDQTGPARIISFSRDTLMRNFTLGQVHDEVEFRISNPLNGPNGASLALQQKAIKEGKLDLAVNYDHGHSQMFVDGVRLPEVIDLREPWYYLPISKELPGRAAMLLLLVVSFMVPAFYTIRSKFSGSLRTAIFLGALHQLACLPFAICCLVGGPWNARLFVEVMMAMLIVIPLSLSYLGIPNPANRFQDRDR
jgi:hypothetical protein